MHFYKLNNPSINGQFFPVCRIFDPDASNYTNFDDDDHSFMRTWLTQNYPSFDVDNFNSSLARHKQLFRKSSYGETTGIVMVAIETNGNSIHDLQEHSGYLFRDIGENNPQDPEFQTYFNYYLTHPSWDSLGSVEHIAVNSNNDIPAEWLDYGQWYWIESAPDLG